MTTRSKTFPWKRSPTPLSYLALANGTALVINQQITGLGGRVPTTIFLLITIACVISEQFLHDDYKTDYSDYYRNHTYKPRPAIIITFALVAIALNLSLSNWVWYSTHAACDMLKGSYTALQWMLIHASAAGIIIAVWFAATSTLDGKTTSNIDKGQLLWLVAVCSALSITLMTPAGSIGFYFKKTQQLDIAFVVNEFFIVSASAILSASFLHCLLLTMSRDSLKKSLLGNLRTVAPACALTHILAGFVTTIGNDPSPNRPTSFILLAFEYFVLFLAVFNITLRLIHKVPFRFLSPPQLNPVSEEDHA